MRIFSSQSQPKANPSDPAEFTIFEDMPDGTRKMIERDLPQDQVVEKFFAHHKAQAEAEAGA